MLEELHCGRQYWYEVARPSWCLGPFFALLIYKAAVHASSLLMVAPAKPSDLYKVVLISSKYYQTPVSSVNLHGVVSDNARRTVRT